MFTFGYKWHNASCVCPAERINGLVVLMPLDSVNTCGINTERETQTALGTLVQSDILSVEKNQSQLKLTETKGAMLKLHFWQIIQRTQN